MDDALRAFLEGQTPQCSVELIWSRDALRFRVEPYLSQSLPPSRFVTSVRAIVLLGERVVALRNRDGLHVMPGGRIERDETYAEALRREVREETGLALTNTRYLGFLHLHHLTPRPSDYAYPYPDMLHPIYSADGVGVVRSGDVDGWETECLLLTIDEARVSDIPAAIPFLDAIVAARASQPR